MFGNKENNLLSLKWLISPNAIHVGAHSHFMSDFNRMQELIFKEYLYYNLKFRFDNLQIISNSNITYEILIRMRSCQVFLLRERIKLTMGSKYPICYYLKRYDCNNVASSRSTYTTDRKRFLNWSKLGST